MDYYDETGNLIDDEDLLFQMLIPSSYASQGPNDVIIDFQNLKHIYDLLIEDEGKLNEDVAKEISNELYGVKTTYTEKLKIWEKYGQSPLLEHLISFEGRRIKAHINVFPDKDEVEKYLTYTSKWIYNKLKTKKENVFILTYEDYKSDYEKKSSNLEFIMYEIDRIKLNIKSIVGKYNLNSKLTEYSNYYEDSTIDVSFFNLKDESKIENLWAVAIGIGLLYGSYQYLSFLNSKKRDLDENQRYKLKSNLSYYSYYTEEELAKIYNNLVKEEYIDENETNCIDFVNIFKEKKFKDIKPILWKKSNSRWLSILTLIELLVKPDYSDNKQFRTTLINCFCFKKDSNIVTDVEKSLKGPLNKIKDEHFLNSNIKGIVEFNK